MLPERLKVWQILLLLLPLLLWWAWSSYSDFTQLEEEGGILYVGRTTKLLYDLGGKWAVVAFPLAVAAAYVWAVWKTLQLSRRADALRARATAQDEARWAAEDGAGEGAPRVAARAAAPTDDGTGDEELAPPRARPTPAASAAPPESPPQGRRPPRASQPPPASQPPSHSRPPSVPPPAAAPASPVRPEDRPPDPAGPRLLR